MGSIRITETNYVGDSSSSIEYEFSDINDYIVWSEYKQEALNKAVKSYAEGLGGEVDIQVAKKPKETKH